MATEEKNTDSEIKVKPKKSVIGRILKFIFSITLFLILLLIGILIFIQTDMFDKIALNYALDKINASLSEKESTIYAESLTGNLFKGFTLSNGSVKVKEDTLLRFTSIEAQYNLWSLLNKEISVQNLIIKEPQINITNVRDKNDSLKWNLSYLLEKTEPDEDTTTSEFDWGITAENLSIENGAIRILEDKNSALPIRDIVMQQLDTFEMSKFDMNNFNLNLSAKYFPDSKEADIKNLSFKTNSDFNLNKLALYVITNKNEKFISIENFSLNTDRTDFKIKELQMEGLEPFDAEDYEEFVDNKINLDLSAGQFNFKDLTFFLPELNFLDSTIALNMKASGQYGNLHIENLNLKMPHSTFTFEGYVRNLDHPSDISFEMKGRDIEIEPSDTKINLPGLAIPDYSYMGKIRIPALTYTGEPELFTTDFDIRTSAGNALGEANMDLRADVIRYKGDFSVTDFNIGKIVKDKELESKINGHFKVDAAGFDYQTASGKLDYDLKRTKFFGQNISSSNGQLNFNRGNIELKVAYNSDAVQTKVAGKINISNPQNISYDLKGTASGLNIASFSKDQSQRSNLNFDFDINGRGFDPDQMDGKYNINLNQSTYGDFILPVTPIVAEIDQNGYIKKISLRTNFANADIDGSINFSALGEVISNNIEKISAAFTQGFISDSTLTGTESNQNPFPAYSYSAICTDLNFKYNVDIKDMAPFYSFTGDDTIIFKGNMSGQLSDSCGKVNFTSFGDIDKLRIKDSLLITDSAYFEVKVRNDIASNSLSSLDASAIIKANKLIISKQTLDTTSASVSFSDSKNKFAIITQRDSTAKLFTEGSLQDSMTFKFDTLALRYQRFVVSNNKDLVVRYKSIDSSQSIDFKQFAINSFNQKLTIAGEYSLTDSSDVKLSASNIDLGTYLKFFSEDPDTTNRLHGVIRYLNLEFKGIPKSPKVELIAVSELLSVGNTQIGRLDANVRYDNYDLTSNISFYNKKNTGKFSLVGNLPMILNFSDEKIDSIQRRKLIEGKNVNLNAIADNFQLRVFQQLLPYTQDLSGILEGKISLFGTPEKPVLTGKMDVNSGKMYVTINKMNYNFLANLSTKDERLLINSSRLFIPSEKSKFIAASGYIDFSGLTFNDMRIEMLGDVKAFDKDNGPTELGISGDLWVGSGRDRLTLTGNPSRFDLRGNLVLVKGNIVFNPFAQEAYSLYSDNLDYGVIIDSSFKDNVTVRKVLTQSKDSVIILKNEQLNPFQKILYLNEHRSEIKKEARKKGGKFFYDIIVSTSGNVFVKFIVNEKSQQEFFGEIITQDLNVYNYVDYTMMGRGTVNLGSNCYYKFFRKFDASGSTTFFGPISNPRLNINAQYKGFASTGSDASGRDQLEDVTIDMRVTGEAVNPVLTMSITTSSGTSTGSDATSDAISFLLFGKFANQLTFSESSSFGASLGASYLSSYLSSSIEQIFPWLINTSFSYIGNQDGTVAQNTDVRFTAAIGDAVVRFGGQIFKGLANTDIIVDYPINKLLKLNSLSNNLIFRFERVYDPFYNDADITNTDGTRVGGLIYYLIKF